MAERIVSPGVFTRENDLSFLAQGVGEIGAAFIGPLKEGPAFIPTIVRSESEFENIFGVTDGKYYTEYAVQNYLREAGTATIVRIAGIGGYTQAGPIGIFVSQSSGTPKLIGTLYSTKAGGVLGAQATASNATIVASTTISGSFTISSSLISVTSASIRTSATNDLSDVFGTSPFGAKAYYTNTYFRNVANSIDMPMTGSAIVAKALPTQDYSGDITNPAYNEAFTPMVKSQLISGIRYDLFRFHTLGHGDAYNTKFKIGISNVKAAGEDGTTDYATFTVTLRAYSDIDRRKSVIETFTNVNLDPASPNYISRRIGDRYYEIDSAGKIIEHGDFSNRSAYIRVEVAAEGSFPVSSVPFGHGAYLNPIATANGDATSVPAVVYQTGSAVNTSSSTLYFSGIDLESTGIKLDNSQYLVALPSGVVTGSNVDFAFDSQLSYQATGSAQEDMAKRQFLLAFQGGYDGSNPIVSINTGADISSTNTQGFNCATATSDGTLAYSKAINTLSNPDEWDINLIAAPGIIRDYHPAVSQKIIDMVEDRQDCFYIADFVGINATIPTVVDAANAVDSNYVATYYPWVKTINTNNNKIASVPPSVLLPAVYAQNDRLAAEWWAPAGLNRGGITGAVSVLNRLTHSERDVLYENKVNPIASFPGQGIVAYGQKTLQDRSSALDRINVRRLLIAVKKFIASTSRYLVFEQNTSTTRNKFLSTVNPYLESIQQRQGLYSFKVVMDDSNNTPDVIDRNIMVGQIYLQPTKTAEFIIIDFNILPTGASFSA